MVRQRRRWIAKAPLWRWVIWHRRGLQV